MSVYINFLDSIKTANENANIHTLSFANLQEFNSFLESFKFTDFPINVVVPFTNNGTWRGGLRKGIIPLQGWILTRIDDDTDDFRSVDIEHDYIEPMRARAINFLREVLESDVIDPEVENVTDSIVPEYAFLSQRLFGVSYRMNVPVVGFIC